MSTLSTSLSGMLAATTRLGVSAGNTANAQSTRSPGGGAYVQEDVVSEETAGGGVSTRIQARTPASVPVFNPDDPSADQNGMTQNPNVDLGGEAVEQSLATYDFQANLMVARTQEKMQQNLLDIYV